MLSGMVRYLACNATFILTTNLLSNKNAWPRGRYTHAHSWAGVSHNAWAS